MIVEEFACLPRPGADWQGQTKQLHQVLKRLGIPFRVYTEETGLVRRVHFFLEFPSLAEREKFWSKPPSDVSAITEKNPDYWDLDTLEHHYYNVFI